jgi:hypothetical protein
MTNWLKESVLKVTKEKTGLLTFHRMDCLPVTIILIQVPIKSVMLINVLGLNFDTKLNWFSSKQLNKKSALHAIRLT